MPEKSLNRRIQAARGDRPVDLLIRNARLVNVFSGRVQETQIAVDQGHVVGLGPYESRQSVDLQGRFVAPGFIDAHVHIESAMSTPAGFAGAVVPRGTTTVVADPHEIANVMGLQGVDYMMEASRHLPLNVFFTLPSCVPATAMETAGAHLSAEDLTPFMTHPRIVGLAEMMNFPGVIYEDPEVLAKLSRMRRLGKSIDGHAPGVSGRMLSAYLTPGIGSDHECTTAAEAQEKLAVGMFIMVREGSAARNLDDLLPVVDAHTARRMMWCTDDRHPHDLVNVGSIDSIVRRAVRQGLNPVTAIQMATLNPAEYFGLRKKGAVAPGRHADLVVFDDIDDPVVRDVYVAGRLVAEAGKLRPGRIEPAAAGIPGTMKVPLTQLDFHIPARGRRMRVIEVRPDQIVTREKTMDAAVSDGAAVADPGRDLLKIVVVERHHGTGRTGVGFIRGFGLQQGALASSVAHDSHNIVAVGVDDRDLLLAVRTLVESGGGLVAVSNGQAQAELTLPIAGLMTDQPVPEICRQLDALLCAARQMGTRLPDPFMTLSFMALPVIPALKLTDHGLVDVARFEVVPLFVD